jgi:hypothetical protein
MLEEDTSGSGNGRRGEVQPIELDGALTSL